MAFHCYRAALLIQVSVFVSCLASCAPEAEPVDAVETPSLPFAAQIPGLAGCYGPFRSDLAGNAEPIDGPAVSYTYAGDLTYTLRIDGAESGQAQFAPVGGIAHFGPDHPDRQGSAVGANLAIDSLARMQEFIDTAYENYLKSSLYDRIQLFLVAVHPDVFVDETPDPSRASGYGYFSFEFISATDGFAILLPVRIEASGQPIAQAALEHGVSIGGSEGAPRLGSDDADSLYAFFREIIEAGIGFEVDEDAAMRAGFQAYARLPDSERCRG